MSQVITKENTILEEVNNLTDEQQDKVLEFIRFLQYQDSNKQNENNELNIIEEKSDKKDISFAEDAKEFIGCVEGAENLSQLKQKLKRVKIHEVLKG
ncbi:hypothetical protein [Geminocystis herdmanii]|uniref:hypothetical protein n=1 Tax=Geminocystis herdmanii TaxID=669359 RepID=UPI00034CA1C0|nr:hypothetical protein [Geminocystis herdmanii]